MWTTLNLNACFNHSSWDGFSLGNASLIFLQSLFVLSLANCSINWPLALLFMICFSIASCKYSMNCIYNSLGFCLILEYLWAGTGRFGILFSVHIPSSFTWASMEEFRWAWVCGSSMGSSSMSCKIPPSKHGSCCAILEFFNTWSSGYDLQADSNIIYCTGVQNNFAICFMS